MHMYVVWYRFEVWQSDVMSVHYTQPSSSSSPMWCHLMTRTAHACMLKHKHVQPNECTYETGPTDTTSAHLGQHASVCMHKHGVYINTHTHTHTHTRRWPARFCMHAQTCCVYKYTHTHTHTHTRRWYHLLIFTALAPLGKR